MFQDGEYIDQYRRAVQSRLLSFCEAKYLPKDVETTVDVRQLYANAAPRIFKSMNPRVIIVMKNYFNAAATAIMMRRFGCRVVICRSGREAYRKYLRNGSQNFHLAIIQWDLDDMGGRDLVYYEKSKGGELVYLAAVPEKMAAEDVVRSGADLFLRMPLCIHMHVLRGLLLPNLQSSYAFPVSAMKLRPNHQVLKNLLESIANHTSMDKETEDIVREANQQLYQTQDSVLDANMSEFNNLLGKLKKVVDVSKKDAEQHQNTPNFAASTHLLGAFSRSESQALTANQNNNSRSIHPLRNTSTSNAFAEAEIEKLKNENSRLTSAFGAALKTFNEMKTEITHLSIQRQQMKRFLQKKPEITDVVSPFDPGASIEAMERQELYKVISQLRHHVSNLLAENETLTEDYERLCHFKVELEEDMYSGGVGVIFNDIESVVVANQDDRAMNYAEHALKLLLSGDSNMSEDEKEGIRKEASAIRARRKSLAANDSQNNNINNARRASGQGTSRRKSIMTPGEKKVSFSVGRSIGSGGFFGDFGSASLNSGLGRECSVVSDHSVNNNNSGNPTPYNPLDEHQQHNQGEEEDGMNNNNIDGAAKSSAILLHDMKEELHLARNTLNSYEKTSMLSHDKYLQSQSKIKVNVPSKIPFYLDPIGNSNAPHDVAYDQSVEFVKKVLDLSHSFVERTVTVTPSLFMRADEFIRSLNKALTEYHLSETRERVEEHMRDRNIRERNALTEGFNHLKQLREQLAKEKNLPVNDLVLIRKAEVLRKQAARTLARQFKANQMWQCYRKWASWAKTQKLNKAEHSHALEIQAFQASHYKETRKLHNDLDNERKAHRLLAVDNSKNVTLVDSLKREVEKLRGQDMLKDRTIARLNEKLLTAMAIASKDGSIEQLRLLAVGKERQEVAVQTEADVHAAVSLAIMKQQEKGKLQREKLDSFPETGVQCNLLSDETLETTIDYAIREFIKATNKMNMWATQEELRKRKEVEEKQKKRQEEAKSIAQKELDDEKRNLAASSRFATSGVTSGDLNSKSEAVGAGGGGSSTSIADISASTTPELSTTTTPPQTVTPQDTSIGDATAGSSTKNDEDGGNDTANNKPSAALSKLKSKAQKYWDIIINQTEMKKLMKKISHDAISHMAPATAALNEEREKITASLHSLADSTKKQAMDMANNNNHSSPNPNLAQGSPGRDLTGRRKIKPDDNENDDDNDQQLQQSDSWAITSTPLGRSSPNNNTYPPPPPKPETADIGIVTDEHGLADAIASAEEISAAKSGISRRKLQQEKEAARFPTITEAAKSVNELQRFSKLVRDTFDVNLHFYFETASPTTLEVVREFIRGIGQARAAILRGEYLLNKSQRASSQNLMSGNRYESPNSGNNNHNNQNPMSKSAIVPPIYQRLYEQRSRAQPGVRYDATASSANIFSGSSSQQQYPSGAVDQPRESTSSSPQQQQPGFSRHHRQSPPLSITNHQGTRMAQSMTGGNHNNNKDTFLQGLLHQGRSHRQQQQEANQNNDTTSSPAPPTTGQQQQQQQQRSPQPPATSRTNAARKMNASMVSFEESSSHHHQHQHQQPSSSSSPSPPSSTVISYGRRSGGSQNDNNATNNHHRFNESTIRSRSSPPRENDGHPTRALGLANFSPVNSQPNFTHNNNNNNSRHYESSALSIRSRANPASSLRTTSPSTARNQNQDTNNNSAFRPTMSTRNLDHQNRSKILGSGGVGDANELLMKALSGR